MLVNNLYNDNRRCVRPADCGQAGQSGDVLGEGKRAKKASTVEAKTVWSRLGGSAVLRPCLFQRQIDIVGICVKACAQLSESDNNA